MIKKHRRKSSGSMRRTSRVFLKDLNDGKSSNLRLFLFKCANIVRYFIESFWSVGDFSSDLADKSLTDRAVSRFNITARLSQLLAKQAKEIVISQHKKARRQRTMPLFRNITITLDSRFFVLTEFTGKFDWGLRLSSGFPKIVIPFNNTGHTCKFLDTGWKLGPSIRLGIRKDRIFVDLIFEKERPSFKSGKVMGVDLGYRCLAATSDHQIIGTEIRDKIRNSGKRRKSFHHYIQTEINRLLKTLNLEQVGVVVLENLKNVKKNTRGKFSRSLNRFLSHWHYSRAINWIQRRCEELGILISFKDPRWTSQRCPLCGKIDKKNRNGLKFKCVHCSYQDHADTVGALNLRSLQLAGVYSLRSLPTS